jgi:GT2 family glycosyltransferase
MIIATLTALGANVSVNFLKSFLTVRDLAYIIQEGPHIADNRNQIWKTVKQREEDVLFVDSDMVFTREDVIDIWKHLDDKDVVTGLCVMSEEGHPASVFEKKGSEFKKAKVKSSLFEVDACGAAFLAISKRVLLDNPFEQIWNDEKKEYYGEDISFCIRAKEKGHKIYCDPKIRIGHIKPKILYY